MLKQLDILIGFVVVMSVVSLLITIITQMVSAVLALREQNLVSGLKEMFATVDPQIGKQAKALANAILTHPIISDSALPLPRFWPFSFWKRATAIRSDELIKILKEIAANTVAPATNETPATKAEAAAKLLAAVQQSSGIATGTLSGLKAALPTLQGNSLVEAHMAIAKLEDKTHIAVSNIEKWFNSMEDRTQQWFATHARIVTVVAAIITAFFLQLDTFKLVSQLSSDNELRSKLVAESAPLKAKADKILTEAPVSPDQLFSQSRTRLGAAADLSPIKDFSSVSDAQKWLQDNEAKPESERADKKTVDAVKALLNNTQTIAREALDNAKKEFTAVTDEFSKSKFQLIPDPYPDPFYQGWTPRGLHFWGLVASAGLLSLGAPFWFNTLKSLTNLRPILANEVEKNPTQADRKS